MKINGEIIDLLPRETVVLRRGGHPLEVRVSAYPLDWLSAAEQEWAAAAFRRDDAQAHGEEPPASDAFSRESAYLEVIQAFYWAVREDIGPGKTLEFETRWENDAQWFYRAIATELTAIGLTYGDIETVILKAMELSGLTGRPSAIA